MNFLYVMGIARGMGRCPFESLDFQKRRIIKGREENCVTHPEIVISQIIHHHSYHLSERASAHIPKKKLKKGSITIQLALVIPLFFLAVMCLLYFMEMMAIKTKIRVGMQYAAQYAAEKVVEVPILSSGKMEEKMVEAIGANRLDASIIEGGSGGLNCQKSWYSNTSGMINLRAQYKLQLPFPVFAVPLISFEEEMRVKGWTGYKGGGLSDKEEKVVYITETGMVYHRKYSCTHLDLSIREVQKSEVKDLRNESQGKYYACETCAKSGNSLQVYVTNTGDRYHKSLGCSGLKRTIYTIPLSETAGKGACSRCSSN